MTLTRDWPAMSPPKSSRLRERPRLSRAAFSHRAQSNSVPQVTSSQASNVSARATNC
jgi:hypothetical protein